MSKYEYMRVPDLSDIEYCKSLETRQFRSQSIAQCAFDRLINSNLRDVTSILVSLLNLAAVPVTQVT